MDINPVVHQYQPPSHPLGGFSGISILLTTNHIYIHTMKPDYTTIYYKMYTLDGDTIKGESNCFEAMVMLYRQRLKKRAKHDRAQRGSLQYRFPHTEYVKY